MIPWQDLESTLSRDFEFQHAIRHWTARLRVSVGDQHHRLRIEDGKLTELAECKADDACEVFVRAPENEWRALLQATPAPFYQELLFAVAQHGFEINRNPLDYAAYYPALRRVIEVLRTKVSAESPGAS